MENNKTGKYLKYAIGEIILVVIGILIALSINNWNEGRKSLVKERITLSNLNSEFRENLKDLDSINTILLRTIQVNESIFNMIQPEPIEDSKTIDSLLSLAITSPSWKPSEFVLNELKNSGGLSKLNNDELKKQLFHWSRFFNELQETMAQLEDTNTELISFIKDHGSLRNADTEAKTFNFKRSQLNTENVSLLQNFQFENMIDDKLFVLIEARNEYARAKELIQTILQTTATE
ncbi:MAG: hypothetical protein KJO96_02250 [Winogradskyella sp.]|nr:hypothetical protein [Winogradskyella sp.]